MGLRLPLRLVTVTVAVLVVCVAPIAHLRSDQVATTLRVGKSFSFSTLDPARTQGASQLEFPIWDRLLKFTPSGKIAPSLARSVSRPNPFTYIYHLRRGVRFWNGNEMTATDVAHSLNYQRFPEFQSASAYANVRSITATDRYTVTVKLKRRDASWASTLAWQGPIFEKKFQQENKETFGRPGTFVMATGPWKIDRFDPTTGLELSANPRWWGGKVSFPRISFKFFADETNMAIAFRAGEIDVAFPNDTKAFGSTAGARLDSVPTYSNGYFGINTQLGPWKDVHVRRAVAYALNKGAIIAASGAPATPLATFLSSRQLRMLASPAEFRALVKSVPIYPYNLVKAKQEMSQSAYPNGFSSTTHTIAIGNFDVISQVIASDLKKIGIDLEIRVMPVGEWVTEVYGPKTYGPLFTTITFPSPDPSSFPNQLLPSKAAAAGGLNFANYSSRAVDELLRAGVTNQDPAERLAVYGRLLRRVGTDVPYVPLYTATANLALASQFTWPTFNGNFYYYAWPLDIKPR